MRKEFVFKFVLSFVLILPLSACSLFNSPSSSIDPITFRPSTDFLNSAEDMSTEEESVVGRAVAARILAIYRPLKNKKLDSYINEVGQTIVAASERPNTFRGYVFIVLDSEEINAIAAPGGFVFITSGFLRLLGDEDSLAAVLAHEVIHIVKKHGLKSIKPGHFADYMQVGENFASAVDCSGLSSQVLFAFKGAVNDVVETLLQSGYSREFEFEADEGALMILQKAGYDPKSLHKALEILKAKKNSEAGWFSTHPDPSLRLESIGDVSISQDLAKPGYNQRLLRFKNFQALILTD